MTKGCIMTKYFHVLNTKLFFRVSYMPQSFSVISLHVLSRMKYSSTVLGDSQKVSLFFFLIVV
jgi:hypothetical protein